MSSKKIALVTGGNRGIGLEICRQLAADGHTVLLGARNPDKARAAAESLQGSVTPLHLDVTREEDGWAAADILREGFDRRLDVLINNAAIMDRNRLSDLDEGEFRRTLETNFFGVLRLVRTMLPLLEKSEDPRIINVSSGMGALDSMHEPGYVGYRFSKWALNGLTMMLAGEFADGRIKVNALCPGWVRTDMGGQNASRSVAEGADTAVWLATTEGVPTGKFFRDRKEIPW